MGCRAALAPPPRGTSTPGPSLGLINPGISGGLGLQSHSPCIGQTCPLSLRPLLVRGRLGAWVSCSVGEWVSMDRVGGGVGPVQVREGEEPGLS